MYLSVARILCGGCLRLTSFLLLFTLLRSILSGFFNIDPFYCYTIVRVVKELDLIYEMIRRNFSSFNCSIYISINFV